MKSIAVFNNKGGVGKTTLLCNLASYLSLRKGKKVLVIDADPQCNTSSYVLDENQFFEVYYNDYPKVFTIVDLIPPLEDGSGFINGFDITMSRFFGFDIIPGNPRFAVSEDFLAQEWKDVKSSDIRGIKSTMLFIRLLDLCKDYDYVFFDMGPSLGAINRSILLACDFFITPMSSDVFSLLALGNIGESIRKWSRMFNNGIMALEEEKRKQLDGMRKECRIKFLGYVEQQYITKNTDGKARAVKAYDNILKKIPREIDDKIIKPINCNIDASIDYKIGSIPNFYSLVPMSQTSHKPIFELLNSDGVVGAHYQKVKDYDILMNSISARMMDNEKVIEDND